jgi:hypothetical protein
MNPKELRHETGLRLRDIIKDKLSVDIYKDQRRLHNVVAAKMMYTVILRDEWYTWESIARSIKRNHSTIMYHYRTLPDILKFDKALERKYIQIRNEFCEKVGDLEHLSVDGLEALIIDLRNQNKVLNLRIQELERKL